MKYRIAALALLPSLCFAQGGSAELYGSVLDSAGLPVAQAKIAIEGTMAATRHATISDVRGEYHLSGLSAGGYTLTAEHTGFQPWRQTGIVLRLATRTTLDIHLEVGQQSQTMEVVGAAPLLQTGSGEVSLNLDEKKLSTLPLDGRNFIPLLTLSPGVSLPNGQLLPRINGSRPRTNEYLYDGISVRQPEPGQVAYYPILDGMAEVKLNVNAYSPEYGRSNGGTVMVMGKSGGNEFHGSVFEYFRNEAMNARNLFARPGPKPLFRRNQYGLTLGGPVQRNKTFFFTDWQGTRLRNGITRFSVVPTPVERQGTFRQAVYDPATSPRTLFAANTLPVSRFEPLILQLLQRYPLPNIAGASNFVRTDTESADQDQADFRLDRYFGPRHRAFGRYTFFNDKQTPVTPLPDGSGSLTSGALGHAVTSGGAVAADYSWIRSNSALNQFRFGHSRRALNQTTLQGSDVRIPGLPQNSFASVLPTFTITGLQQLGPAAGANSSLSTSVTEFLDTFTLVRGRHTFKAGADIRREALDVLSPPNPTGAFAFTTTGTNSPVVPQSGNALASFFLGQVDSFSLDIQRRVIQPRASVAEFFFGDDWKVSRSLSLNLGTRYTLNFPSTEKTGQGAVFNLNSQILEFPRTAREVHWKDFGPRLGLAWKARENFVVRAGYGMLFFEQSGITSPFTLPQFPFIQTVGQRSPDNSTAAFSLGSGPTIQVTAPNPNSGLGQGVFGVDRTNGSGYSQQWNFTLQRIVGSNWNLEAGYLGSKNTRLGIPDANINQLPAHYLSLGPALLTRVPNPFLGQIPASSSLSAETLPQQQLLRPYPKFTTVALFRNNVGNSGYNALALKLEKRMLRALTVNASFTYSKLLDDASSVFSQTIFTGPVLNSSGAADAYNRHLEKDVSTGDIPRTFALGWVWEIPRWWKLSGIELAGMVRVQTGNAVAVTQALNNNSSLGYAVQRPNRSADPNNLAGRTVSKYFNTAAFSAVPQFVIGNSSRNPVRGPGLQNADLMLGKTFHLRETLNLEVRAEVFNVSNTPPLNDPNGSFGSPAFGSITSAGNPRVFEFVARLRF